MVLLQSPTCPATLYAFQLRLRPLQQGTLMAFSGELVHGALMHWFEAVAPEIARWLHDGNKQRLFACSSVQFPLTEARICEAERKNIHLPLDPAKTYTIRVTLLFGELLPLFHHALTRFNIAEQGAGKPPFIRVGKQVFLLEEVIANHDASSEWTDFTSFQRLVEKAKTLRLGKIEPLELEFATLTTFKRSNKRSQVYGGHFALLPLPQYVFPGLAKRWQELAPAELAGVVQMERIAEYIEDEGIVISNYDLRPRQVHFSTHLQPGFVGRCQYELRGPDRNVTEESPLTIRQQLLMLVQMAFYTGIGYKTAMGMGQVRPRAEKG